MVFNILPFNQDRKKFQHPVTQKKHTISKVNSNKLLTKQNEALLEHYQDEIKKSNLKLMDGKLFQRMRTYKHIFTNLFSLSIQF